MLEKPAERRLFFSMKLPIASGYGISGINETQASETECAEACWSNYPVSEAYRD